LILTKTKTNQKNKHLPALASVGVDWNSPLSLPTKEDELQQATNEMFFCARLCKKCRLRSTQHEDDDNWYEKDSRL
jgi:hypothetical protein